MLNAVTKRVYAYVRKNRTIFRVIPNFPTELVIISTPETIYFCESTPIAPQPAPTQCTRFANRGAEKSYCPAKFCLSAAMQHFHTRVPKHLKVLGHFRSYSAGSHLRYRGCSTTRKDRGSWRPTLSTGTSPIQIPTQSNMASGVNS